MIRETKATDIGHNTKPWVGQNNWLVSSFFLRWLTEYAAGPNTRHPERADGNSFLNARTVCHSLRLAETANFIGKNLTIYAKVLRTVEVPRITLRKQQESTISFGLLISGLMWCMVRWQELEVTFSQHSIVISNGSSTSSTSSNITCAEVHHGAWRVELRYSWQQMGIIGLYVTARRGTVQICRLLPCECRASSGSRSTSYLIEAESQVHIWATIEIDNSSGKERHVWYDCTNWREDYLL